MLIIDIIEWALKILIAILIILGLFTVRSFNMLLVLGFVIVSLGWTLVIIEDAGD
jgi:hypothetical protein